MKNKVLLLLFLAGFAAGCRFKTSKDDDDDTMDAPAGTAIHSGGNGVYSLENKAGVKTAQLNLEAGAMVININNGTEKLFNAVVNDTTRKFVLTEQTTSAAEMVNFTLKKEHENKAHNDSTTAEIRLSTQPQWDIKAKVGAAQCDFDLSKLKVSNLGLDCAAGEVKLKLAPALPDTYVKIKAAVADITVRIPRGTACEVEIGSAIADNDLSGFRKKDDDHYETPGFASAKNKIHVKADCALSAFKIDWY